MAEHIGHSYTKDRKVLLNRLRRLEGQVRGIAQMVADDRYCIDILHQLQAVRAALSKVEGLVLKDKLYGLFARFFLGQDPAKTPAMPKAADLLPLTPAKRLEELLLAWLASLATHRAVTGQMLLYKLEPGHIHLQIGGLLRISRTVQWWREAAQRETLHLRRIAEESLLTGVYLRCFIHWLRHPEENPADFRALLRRQLRCGPLLVLLRR